MGKEKIKIQKINDIAAKQVTFSKRRKGLFKKASELSILCDVKVAVFVVSPAGRLFHYASTNTKDILDKFDMHMNSLKLHDEPLPGKPQNKSCSLNKTAESKILRCIMDTNLQEWSVDELCRLEAMLEQKLSYVRARKECQEKNRRANWAGETSHSTSKRSFGHVHLQRWIPPPSGVYKVNFAGFLFTDLEASGVGVVIRNCNGDFMAAIARFFPQPMNATETSAMAAKCAAEFAADYYFTHIILEGDNWDILEHLQLHDDEVDHEHGPNFGELVQEAKEYMKGLSDCSISYVERRGNKAAHLVAQYARNVRGELVWLMAEPDFLMDILQADMDQHKY